MTRDVVEGVGSRRLATLRRTVAVLGPGLLAMLADTDAGSIVTAAQSGAQWRYKLLALQVLLVPVLCLTQELTARLGIVTGKGHAALIREHYGLAWAWVSTSALILACIGALLTEFGGLEAVGAMLHVPSVVTVTLVVAVLVGVAVSGSYESVERIAIAVGAFEAAFIVVAAFAHPSLGAIVSDTLTPPITDPSFLTLISANIGAVIMPWMVFYQQSSVIEKGLTDRDLAAARKDTLIGAVVTQAVMVAVLVAAAAALSHRHEGSLDEVGQIADALTAVLGTWVGRVCFGLGIAGASLVAAIVVTLTGARTLGELLGYRHTLDKPLGEAPLFYIVYAAILAVAAAVVLSGANIISLSVGVQVMNAMLLPIVLGFLFLLARRLPEPHRLSGGKAAVVGVLMAATALLGLYAGVTGNAR